MGYYMGDYYRGDPFFGSLLGLAVKGVKGLVGLATKKSVPKLLTAGSEAAAGRASTGIVRGAIERAAGGVAKHPTLSAAATAGTIGVLGGTLAHRRGALAPGMRRHRRMRVTNVKALRRAIRRSQGFAKLAKRVLHFTSPRAPRGRAVFKARRRKKI